MACLWPVSQSTTTAEVMLLHGLVDILSPNPMTAAPLFRLADLQFRTGLLDWKERSDENPCSNFCQSNPRTIKRSICESTQSRSKKKRGWAWLYIMLLGTDYPFIADFKG